MKGHRPECACFGCLYMRQVKKIDAEHDRGLTTVEEFAERQVDAACKFLLTRASGFSIKV